MYNLLANASVEFTYANNEMIKKAITSFTTPLEYAVIGWNPDVEKIEKVKKVDTRNLSFEERLIKLQLPILKGRRKREVI